MIALRKLLMIGLLQGASAFAWAEGGQWYLEPTFGLSRLGDTGGERIDGTSQRLDVETDGGFSAGLTLGYRYSDSLSTEIGWEFRSNDSVTTYADGTRFPEGNYASSVFFVNGVWHLDARRQWRPYLGAGLAVVQEIDIDLESAGIERSFSDSGNVGLQVFGGVDYALSEQWLIGAELRYMNLGTIDLPAEENATGSIEGLDYDPLTFGLTLTYQF